MVELQARLGDAQALKACIAAEVAGAAVSIKETNNATPSLFGAQGVALVLPNGEGVLTEPNTIARYLGERVLLLVKRNSLA